METPIIIFGDHTRILKYINFPIALGADGAKALQVDVKKAFTKYVYYFLKRFRLHDAGYSRHFKYLKRVKIPIPENYDDQIRIAGILSRAEGLIEKRKESLRLLDEFLKSTFLEMFGDPVRNEMGWEKRKLNEFIEFLTSGSRGWAKYYSQNGTIFLRIQNIRDAKLLLEDLQYVQAPDSAEKKRTKVKSGDLIFSITADLGRTAVIPIGFGEANINQHLALFRLNNDMNPIYAAHYFQMPIGKMQVKSFDRGGVKSGLNFDNIRNFEIENPPLSLQKQFASIVEKIETIKAKYQVCMEELERLYGFLRQRAFKGELDLSVVVLEMGEVQLETG